MGRPTLARHRKFRRLARAVDAAAPGFGTPLARGLLEAMWETAYESGDAFLGDAADVEEASGWEGAPGVLVAALCAAGGDGHAGLVDEGGTEWWPDGKPGTFRVHDLWDHAPDFVKGRAEREAARRAKGTTLTELRREAGKKGGLAKAGKRPADAKQAHGEQVATGATPARAPAPTQEAAAARSREDDSPAPKPIPVLDVSGLGALGSEWVCRLERELGRGLAAATPEVRDELEQLLQRPGYGDPDRALAWVATTLEARRRGGGPVPGSVAYAVRVLGSMPPLDVGGMDRARQACPEWARVLDAAMALPAGNAPTEHQLRDLLLPLKASFLRGELHLEAADEGRRAFLEEFFGDGLRRLAIETIGPHVLVRLWAAGAGDVECAPTA